MLYYFWTCDRTHTKTEISLSWWAKRAVIDDDGDGDDRERGGRQGEGEGEKTITITMMLTIVTVTNARGCSKHCTRLT